MTSKKPYQYISSAFKCFLGLSLAFVIAIACDKEDKVLSVQAEFSYVPDSAQPNVIVFKNTSAGEVYYVRWIFGNGERTGRIPVSEGQSMRVLYPEKGDYEVEMTVWGSETDLTDNSTITKTISIEKNVFSASFEVALKPDSENEIVLTNTSGGLYDKIEWLIDGEKVNDEGESIEVYLPFKGQYNVGMTLSQGEYSQSIQQAFTIAVEDPMYLEHFQLVWSDEFDGTSVDDSKWLHETGDHGWGNNEWQNYTPGDNASVGGGLLSISAVKTGDGQKTGDYTSSRLNSTGSFTYGKFEIRAKMPEDKGPGVWPAIWMLGKSIQNGTSWPLCGEIDIMEYVSFDPNHVSSSIHTQSNNHAAGNPIGTGHIALETAEEEFHVYGLLWTERYLKFYRDDISNVLLTYERPNNYTPESWPFDAPFYILLNMAVGGNYGGAQGVDDSIFPAVMEVDYVRVYQHTKS